MRKIKITARADEGCPFCGKFEQHEECLFTLAEVRERERAAFVAGGSWQEANTNRIDWPVLDDRKAEALRRYGGEA